MKKTTILLYGRTNSGKTAQLGVLAEHVHKTYPGKILRLYTGDRGGTRTIEPHIGLGLIEVEAMGDSDPWIFLNNAVRGRVRDKSGKWVNGDNSRVGCFAFESLRAFAEALLASMAQKSAQGISIGGGANISFTVTGDGETVKVSGSNMAHFGVAQGRMTEEVWQSQKLDAPYIVWTSSVSKDDDLTSSSKVLGPDVIGKALTTEVPRWFDLTFRLDVIPAKDPTPERHILYLGSHVDVGAGNAAGLGNIRLPLDAPVPAKLTVEPANLVTALQLIEGGQQKAIDELRKRIGTATQASK